MLQKSQKKKTPVVFKIKLIFLWIHSGTSTFDLKALITDRHINI